MSINREQLEAQLAEIARRRQIAAQMSQPQERIQQAGGLVVPYSAGEGLAQLGQAFFSQRANKKLDEREATARKGYDDTVRSASDEYTKSVPDNRVPGEIIRRVMSQPPDKLMDPANSRSEATRKLSDVVRGPTGSAEAMLQRAEAQGAPYTLSAGQQRRGANNEIVAEAPQRLAGATGQTGSLQEIEAINDYIRREAAGELLPGEVDPRDYLSSRRGTSGDKQLYAEYIIGLPEGQQPLPMNEFLVDHRKRLAGAEAEGKAEVIPADDRIAAQNKEPRAEAARRRLERVSQASTALDNNLLSGGPMQGRAIGVTEEGNELDQANAQLLTELTALTRTPGLGSQSDFEQRLAQLVLPTADMYPSVRKKAIAELEAFMGDLDYQIQRIGRGEAPDAAEARARAKAGQGAAPEVEIESLLDKYAPAAR